MLAGLGAASGLLSWLLVDFADELKLRFEYELYGIQLTPVAIYPGLVFGLLFGAFLRLRAGFSWLRAIGYVLATLVGYGAAFHTAFYIIANGFADHESLLAFAIGGVPAGFAGSLILGLLTRPLAGPTAASFFQISVIVGTSAGALLGLAGLDTHNAWGFLLFFVLWQGSYAACLAPLLSRRLTVGL